MEQKPLPICSWLILCTLRNVSSCFYTHTFTNITALSQIKSCLNIKPHWLLWACPHVLSLIHYHRGSSKNAASVVSSLHGAFEATCCLCSTSYFSCPRSLGIVSQGGFFCFQCDPDLTVHVLFTKIRSNPLFTWRHKSNFCFCSCVNPASSICIWTCCVTSIRCAIYKMFFFFFIITCKQNLM